MAKVYPASLSKEIVGKISADVPHSSPNEIAENIDRFYALTAGEPLTEIRQVGFVLFDLEANNLVLDSSLIKEALELIINQRNAQ